MDTLSILNDLIKPAASINLHDDFNNKKRVEFKEPSYPQSNVVISGLPQESFIVNADKFESPQKIFRGEKGECKRADYILITKKDSHTYAIFIELKATTDKKSEIVKQLHGAKCVFLYIKEIGKSFWNERKFLENCSMRYVKIDHSTLALRPSRKKSNSGLHDTPENMLKISYTKKIQFNHLLGHGQTND